MRGKTGRAIIQKVLATFNFLNLVFLVRLLHVKTLAVLCFTLV